MEINQTACPAGQRDELFRLWQSQKTRHHVQRNTAHHLKKLLRFCDKPQSTACLWIAHLQVKQPAIIHAHTHTHPFNGPFSGTTRVSRYQKGGKTNLHFTEARDSEWQWHQLGHMQVCTSLQTDNHASTPPLSFLQAGCPSCCPTNRVKALKANSCTYITTLKYFKWPNYLEIIKLTLENIKVNFFSFV